MDAPLVADLMLYNLETAQLFSKEKKVPEAFYKSMLNSFSEVVHYVTINGLLPECRSRLVAVYEITQQDDWGNREGFSRALDIID